MQQRGSKQFVHWVQSIFDHVPPGNNFHMFLIDNGQVSAVVLHYTVLTILAYLATAYGLDSPLYAEGYLLNTFSFQQ